MKLLLEEILKKLILGNNVSFYDIKITGKDVKRFLHNLHKMHIEFLNIVFDKNSVIIKVSESDYKRILDIKTIYEIEIVKVYGIAYIKYFLKKYWLFLTILSFGFLLFLGLTHIIFEIEVVHNDKELREILLEELSEQGIHKYGLVVSYSKKEEIKEDILKKYKDKIEWLEIERQGTKYVVKVEERKIPEKEDDNIPRNIVAKKDGLIMKITSSSGEILVKKDQYVKKGDILIGGTIHNKEEEVAKVKANGEVYAETWYTVTVDFPYHYHEEKNTGNRKKVIEFKWFQNSYHLLDFHPYKKNKETILFSLKNNILPISISIIEKQELEIIDQLYTKDNAIIEASNIAKKRLIDKLGEDIEILYEKNLKIMEEDSKIEIVMFYKVFENITDYQEIPDIVPDSKIES